MDDAFLRRFLLRAASAAAAAALGYAALRYLLPCLLPFLLAAAAAAAMEPTVRFLRVRLRLRRGFSSLLLTLFLLFLLGGLLSLLVTTLVGEARNLLENVPALLDAANAAVDSLLERADRFGAAAPPWLRSYIEQTLARHAAGAGELFGALARRLLSRLGSFAAALPSLFLGVATTVLAIYFTSSSWPELSGFVSAHLSARARRRLCFLRAGVTRSLARWLRAELTLCAVTFAEVFAGLLFLRRPYALLLAFVITLVDALPVFGTGTVLLPWAAAELLFQNAADAVFLAALYLVTLTVRNVLEPRLLGAQAGLPPVASLFAMYLGFRLSGVAGMVLLPFLLLLGAQLLRRET